MKAVTLDSLAREYRTSFQHRFSGRDARRPHFLRFGRFTRADVDEKALGDFESHDRPT